MKNAIDRLIEKINQTSNPTVVGLDPRVEYLPETLKKFATDKLGTGKAFAEFNFNIIEAIKDIVPAVKIQSAFYEMLGHMGVACMEQTASEAKQAGLIVMGDVKRNDIGSTAEAYAAAFFDDTPYDFITVNPYLGYDGIKPFTDKCKQKGTGIFILARTSNPSAAAIQNMKIETGEQLYVHIGKLIEQWGEELVGENGYSSVGAVVGATNPAEAKELRNKLKTVFFLVPGYGAQGGKGKDAAASFDARGGGAIVNNSRGIIAAHLSEKYKGMDYAKAARAAALDMREDLQNALS